MRLLISDANILIDMEAGALLETLFEKMLGEFNSPHANAINSAAVPAHPTRSTGQNTV